jgi:signal transduction histidine kinase
VSSVRFQVTHVERIAEALRQLRSESFDVMLLDLSLPDAHGLEPIDQVCSAAPHLPVLALTGLDDETLAVRAVQEGAQDYLIKGQLESGQLLARAIRYAIERKRADEARRFLADASGALAASLDHPHPLVKLPSVAVPRIADWCAVDLLEPDGVVRRLAAAYVHAGQTELLDDLELDLELESAIEPDAGVPQVLRSGQAQLYAPVGAEQLGCLALNAEHQAVLQKLDIRSALCVPLQAQGQTLGAITLASGASSRRYGPADLALAEELARRAALAADNARLYREAQQAVRAREQVLAFVSHDLKNPLNTIALSASLLLMPELPEEKRRQQLAVIKRSTERMNHLIQDLMDVAKNQAGKLSVQPSVQEVQPLIAEALELHRPLALKKTVHLDSALDGPLPPVHADRERVLQVFSNLLGNAVKFTPEGGWISIQAQAQDLEVQFAVSDTGPGIPEHDLPHLFDPYWQALRGSRESAGLGLAITKGIVTSHGGRIWVESRLGKGSTFYFTLPVAGDAAMPALASSERRTHGR